ncbi:MAG: aspartate 1-decarboxylase [Ktedonobacteraceae bacterium]
MLRTMCKGKIHRATVTQANLNYVGSITIDQDLLDAANIYPYEKVQVVNINNGSRLETYTIAGARGSGVICLNGAAARLTAEGDLVIIISYAQYTEEEIRALVPQVVFVDADNRLTEKKDVPLIEMLPDFAFEGAPEVEVAYS